MAVDLDFRNTNSLWCSVLVETLVRCGLRHAVISPGSRSTPLTMAMVRHASVDAIPVLDERSAAFFALGLAKRTHLPVVLVCTSGTAAANYLPAVIEAKESATPLLLLTTDRPPEMRDCASGQTIDQQKLFGSFAVFHHEMAVPEPRDELLRYLRQTIAHAFERAQVPQPGPVHVNLPFRDPLPPVADETCAALHGSIDEAFFSHLGALERPPSSMRVWQHPTTARGLIVAGPDNPRDPAAYAASISALAEGLNWPVLADALSPLRHYGGLRVPVIAHYDVIIRDPAASRDLLPRHVICVGDWPTSKALRSWLGDSRAEVVMVGEAPSNRDALHGRTRRIPADPTCLGAEGTPPADPSYCELWKRASDAANACLDVAFDEQVALFEPMATRILAQSLPEATPVFVASSMPVRDVEYFWPLMARRHRFYFNRGANGIDGTLSTAIGVAHGGRPTVLLAGDLAFLHDSNGLLHRSRLRGSLTVVLINNRGGGIFQHLPVAKFDPPFEEFFATPQDVDFGRLCAAHGVAHHLVEKWSDFTSLVAALPETGIRVLEIQTDRKADAARRRQVFADASKAVGAALS